ncbi:MAG: serine hydrolase [Proteobacteria bacterium]|nr:serine hydrolase [Pseudomonadota bacterium]
MQRIQRVADRYVNAQQFAGIEWLIERDGEVAARGSSGVADHASGTAIPKRALYRIYSMTKPIVSLMALMLIEQGKLRLFDMLQAFDADFANLRVLGADGSLVPAQRPVMVEDLLTHRAGFSYEFIVGCQIAPYYREARVSGDGSKTLEEMMDVLAGLPIAHQPGSAFRYGVSTDVLAHVIQRAANRPLDELLKEQIFDPLGMDDTGFAVAPVDAERIMPMYGSGDLDRLPPLAPQPQTLARLDVEDMYPSDRPGKFIRGGHGLFSTLDDYARFARMLLDGRAPDGRHLISSTMHRFMQANRLPADQLPLRIGMNVLPGYGWGLVGRVMLDQGQAVGITGQGEFGWAGAASTFFWVDPSMNLTGTIMTQYAGSALPLADDIRTAAYASL